MAGHSGIRAASAALFLWLSIPLLAPAPAGAELISLADLSRDKIVSAKQCAATPRTVFVTVVGHGYCVRYYLSTVGGESPRPACGVGMT